MKLATHTTDAVVLQELGVRFRRCRIGLDFTQAELARRAGISKRTVERIEDGASTQISSFVRLLRALDLLEVLDALIPTAGPTPMEVLRQQSGRPQRASAKRRKASDRGAWSWGDNA